MHFDPTYSGHEASVILEGDADKTWMYVGPAPRRMPEIGGLPEGLEAGMDSDRRPAGRAARRTGSYITEGRLGVGR